MTTQAWAALLGAYLLRSIPSAWLVARVVAGVDIKLMVMWRAWRRVAH